MTDRWSTIIANAKDHLALDPIFEPTDEEVGHLLTAYEYFEKLGLCE